MGGGLTIGHEYFTAFVDGARERLDQYRIDVPESRVERVLAEGDAAWHIANHAKEQAVDLVSDGHAWARRASPAAAWVGRDESVARCFVSGLDASSPRPRGA